MPNIGRVGPCSPFFVVSNLQASLDHYLGALGFDCAMRSPDGVSFAIVRRGEAQIMLKHIGPEAAPSPNWRRHEWARWDAFVFAEDPQALAQEMAGRGAVFHQPLKTDDDALLGFAIADPDGYVCFFGRPA